MRLLPPASAGVAMTPYAGLIYAKNFWETTLAVSLMAVKGEGGGR
jgi:hypothetical protein